MTGDWWHKALANKGAVTLTPEDVSGLELHILTEVLDAKVAPRVNKLRQITLESNQALEDAGHGFPDDE